MTLKLYEKTLFDSYVYFYSKQVVKVRKRLKLCMTISMNVMFLNSIYCFTVFFLFFFFFFFFFFWTGVRNCSVQSHGMDHINGTK